jgi:hypothetical protein
MAVQKSQRSLKLKKFRKIKNMLKINTLTKKTENKKILYSTKNILII